MTGIKKGIGGEKKTSRCGKPEEKLKAVGINMVTCMIHVKGVVFMTPETVCSSSHQLTELEAEGSGQWQLLGKGQL